MVPMLLHDKMLHEGRMFSKRHSKKTDTAVRRRITK